VSQSINSKDLYITTPVAKETMWHGELGSNKPIVAYISNQPIVQFERTYKRTYNEI